MERQRAELLVKIARVRLQCGRPGDALNYLYQAQSLYPTRAAASLIQAIRGGHFEPSGSSRRFEPSSYRDNRSYYTGCGDCGRAAWEEEEEEEEAEEGGARGMEEGEDYYATLGVRKDVGEEDLRKAYRRLALRYHPDKNSAPGATEAFKAIGKAFAVLSDPMKRKSYDQALDQAHADYEPDLTPEELFDLFFGGHPPTRATYNFGGRHQHQPRPTSKEQGSGRPRWQEEGQDGGRPRWRGEEGQDGGTPRWWEEEERQDGGGRPRWRGEEGHDVGRGMQEEAERQDGGRPRRQEEGGQDGGRPRRRRDERRQDGGKGRPQWWEMKGQGHGGRPRWRETEGRQDGGRPGRQKEAEEEGRQHRPAYSAFIQVLPVLLLVVVSVVAQLTATTPAYSLHHRPSSGLTVPRETLSLGVPYFVGRDFQRQYRGEPLAELERVVEKEYAEQVQAGCWREKQQKSDLANLARLYRDERLREKAETLKMENCQKLSNLLGPRRGG